MRPSGELFKEDDEAMLPSMPHGSSSPESSSPDTRAPTLPLRPMTPEERLLADYAGTSLTIGPHPMALRRGELALRGVLRARDLPRGGRAAGCAWRAP